MSELEQPQRGGQVGQARLDAEDAPSPQLHVRVEHRHDDIAQQGREGGKDQAGIHRWPRPRQSPPRHFPRKQGCFAQRKCHARRDAKNSKNSYKKIAQKNFSETIFAFEKRD